LNHARANVEIVSVQNLYNLTNRGSEAVLSACERDGLAFIPWFPVAAGDLTRPGGPLDAFAAKHSITIAQLALAWLMRRSPAMLPIPGTSSAAHLEENVAAAALSARLTDADMAELDRIAKP
jgi:aryl-alcohol dehydrogenase-like predicted oxidoreductase